MNRKSFGVVLGLTCAVLMACGHTKQPKRTEPVEKISVWQHGKQAFSQGRVLAAYRFLHSAGLQNDSAPRNKYQELIRQVTQATEHIVESWIRHAETELEHQRLQQALAYLEDIHNELPDQDPLRVRVEAKIAPILARLQKVKREIDNLTKQAWTVFESGDTEKAYDLLQRAKSQSANYHLEFPLFHQRLLVECTRREPRLAKKMDLTPKPKHETQPKPVDSTSQPGPVQAVSEPVDPNALRISELFDAARKHLQAGRKSKAILGFEEVLRLDPSHTAAKIKLKQLEPIRKSLIKVWMSKASEHFAREELDKAVPYYDKVLQLDPTNLRAKEGKQMYLRLNQLKRRQK